MAEAPVVVLGAGMAGTAAAFAASGRGARVVVVHDRAGASALTSGALDREPWDALAPAVASGDTALREPAAPLDDALSVFLVALGLHRLFGSKRGEPGLVATQGGIVRPAAGADRALLDLAPLAGRRIAVADAERDDWDAALIARSLAASPWAVRHGTRFEPVAARLLRAGHERRITPYDFAALHDDPERRSALAETLEAASAGFDAWLLGPWLGLEPETPEALRSLVPLPLGETTSLMGGPAGGRFERARDRLLAARGIEVLGARVARVAVRGSRCGVALEPDAGGDVRLPELEARAVVLATGGVAAGGVRLSGERPAVIRGFELSYAAPVTLALDGEALAGGGSLFGPSLETTGLGVLERVGILCDDFGRPVGQNALETPLFAAGDAVAGRPRTMLEAAASGLAAGLAAGNVAAAV